MSMNLFHAYNAWSWHYAFLFGSILSATDPVAVVALLRDVGKFAQFSNRSELHTY